MNTYVFVTVQGQQPVNTPHHHDDFPSMEKFIKEHEGTIRTGLGVSQLILQGIQVYLNGRRIH